MGCSKIKLVSPYIDGELSGKERALFELHAPGCPECIGKLAEFKALHDGFAHAEKLRAPFGFSTRVMAALRQEEQRKAPRFVPWLTGFAEAAVVALMIFTGLIAGRFLTTNGLQGAQTAGMPSSAFEIFEPAPPDSLGGVYLAMTEAHHENR